MENLYFLAISSLILFSAFKNATQASTILGNNFFDNTIAIQDTGKVPSAKNLEFNVSGTITNRKGLPLSKIEVTLFNDCDEEFPVIITKEDGKYRFENLSKNCCFTIKANSIKSNYSFKIKDKICTRGQLSSKDFLIDMSLDTVFVPRIIILSCPDQTF